MSSWTAPFSKVVALAGGVGGARLVDGLAQALPPEALTVVVNTGDDTSLWGLEISPDLDTVMYTLSGLSHPTQGWGLADESFGAFELMARYGGPSWFRLGDRDLATHLRRTELLRRGVPLSEVTGQLFEALGVPQRVLPMSDEPCPTLIDTVEHGVLDFQSWLVRHRGAPTVRSVRLEGAGKAAAPGVLQAIEAAELVVVAPSNPYVSVDPILALAGVRDAVDRRPVVALSPIVGGKAVKGPLAGMLRSIAGVEPSAGAALDHYEGLVDAVVIEAGDEATVSGVPTFGTATVMGDRTDRTRLAREVLDFAGRLVDDGVL